MYVRVQDVTENRCFRWILQTMLRIHGFRWKSRYGLMPCDDIYKVHIRGNRITVYHTAESGSYKTVVAWTRIMFPMEPEGGGIHVHVHPLWWPPITDE